MFQLEWPWVFLLLPLPLLVYFGLPVQNLRQQTALRVPIIDDFRIGQVAVLDIPRRRWHQLLSVLAWSLLVLAASRPQWLGESIEIPISGRDLVLAVDLSDSMRTADFRINNRQVNRLQAARTVASDFINRRRGDRLGLILFGTHAHLQAPLTFDTHTVNQLLQEAAIGLAGERTAIGDAIGLTLKRLDNDSANKRVLILMTDGANTAGEVAPLRAAQLAAARGLKIYTIGIGADEEVEVTWYGVRKRNPSAQLDEKSLRQIAEITGGQYFRARDADELAGIYAKLDELEALPKGDQRLRPVKALFVWPLTLAVLISLLITLRHLRRRW